MRVAINANDIPRASTLSIHVAIFLHRKSLATALVREYRHLCVGALKYRAAEWKFHRFHVEYACSPRSLIDSDPIATVF